MNPMLARSPKKADTQQVSEIVQSAAWLIQPKIDGDRRLIELDGTGNVTGYNRSGEAAIVPKPLLAELSKLRLPMVLDGELLGDRFVAFDLVSAGNQVSPAMALTERLKVLAALMGGLCLPHVIVCPTARTLDEKAAMIAEVRDGRGEGFVAKMAASIYEPTPTGTKKRPRSWVKLKLVKSIDCIVEWIGTEKDNMGLTLYRDGRLVDGGYAKDGSRRGGIAECTRGAGDGRRVQVGDVVEVQCLYASDGDRLVQPTKPRIRHDKDPLECDWSQLDEVRTDQTLVLEMSSPS